VLIKDQPEINRNGIIEGATPGVIKVRLNLQLDAVPPSFTAPRRCDTSVVLELPLGLAIPSPTGPTKPFVCLANLA